MGVDVELFIVILFSNLLGVYSVYKALNLFFEKEAISKVILVLSLIGYEIFIVIIVDYIKMPIALLILTVLIYFLLTFNFKTSLQKRILFTVITTSVFSFAELLSYLIIYGATIEFFNYNEKIFDVLGVFSSGIIKLAAVLMIKVFKKSDKESSLPKIIWISISLLPVLSLIIAIGLIYTGQRKDTMVIIGLGLLALLNFLIIYLYDVLSYYYQEAKNRQVLELKNRYYEQQINTMELSNDNIRGIRHDLINILSLINTCIETGATERAKEYIAKEIDKIVDGKIYSNSGNLELDSILNFKINEMNIKGIEYKLDIRIESPIETADMDLIILLGNLLDNAIEVNNGIVNKYINMVIISSMSCLTIKITNPYEGKIELEDGNIKTKKANKEAHGIGLKNINNVVEKYNGVADFCYENNIFEVKILMYC